MPCEGCGAEPSDPCSAMCPLPRETLHGDGKAPAELWKITNDALTSPAPSLSLSLSCLSDRQEEEEEEEAGQQIQTELPETENSVSTSRGVSKALGWRSARMRRSSPDWSVTVRFPKIMVDKMDFLSKSMGWDRSRFLQRAAASYLARLGHDEALRLQLEASAQAEAKAKQLVGELEKATKERGEALKLARRVEQDLADVRAELERANMKMAASAKEKADPKTEKALETVRKVPSLQEKLSWLALLESKGQIMMSDNPLLAKLHSAHKTWNAAVAAVGAV